MQRLSATVIIVASLGAPMFAQPQTGELRLLVRDPTGSAVRASGVISSDITHVERRFTTDDNGSFIAQSLRFGLYRVSIERTGFAAYSAVVDVRSPIPLRHSITLELAPVVTTVRVAPDAPPLIDPYRSGTASVVGTGLLRSRPSAPPGHSIVDLVDTLPGWFETSNGVLHPRGAEYQVQYVIDGVPLRDNRSPAFAQSLGVEEFESLTARTAGYPAEFGGKLGGVIELTTVRDRRQGFHGTTEGQIGSFSTFSGYGSGQFVRRGTTVGASLEGMATDRYLDPPVEENFSNRGTGVGVSARGEQEWSETDRSRAYFHRRSTDFLVPNERFQQLAGQRQDRTSDETLVQLSHQHIVSARAVAQGAVMARSTRATLESNATSTPIRPQQDRGFSDIYANGSLTFHSGAHDLKAGGELTASTVDEAFASETLAFADRRHGREQAAYVQDFIRVGPAAVSVGVRYDHYSLVEHEQAFSPRISASYFVERRRLVVHGSYDRAFETPPVENVLLASSGEAPLRSSRGHFFEAGVAKELFGRARVDVNAYRRAITNFFDDDLLLNTAVSFPFTFASATINGIDTNLDLPRWGRTAASFRYSYSRGIGQLPLAGGLILEGGGSEATGAGEFPISEDQRHTLRSRLRVDVTPRFSLSGVFHFDSGLPIEIDGDVDKTELALQYGARVVEQVDFEAGRVKPSMAFDASASFALWKTVSDSGRVQVDVFNLFDRLNVINFASLLSGTAIGPGRAATIRVRAEF
jgi:hypothetical protein